VSRSLFTGSINGIDSFITDSQHLLSMLPRSHPLSPAGVYRLAAARFKLHELSNEEDNLDKSILHSTGLILFPHSVLARTQIKYPSNFLPPRRSTFSRARMNPSSPKMPLTQPNTSAIFETSPTKCSGSRAMELQHFSWMHWPFKWSWEPEA
jgi:hypothetical protein